MAKTTLEDELEATLWTILRVRKVTTDQPLELIEDVKTAARAYGAGDSDALTAARRAVLAREGHRGGSGAVVTGGVDLELRPSGSSVDRGQLQPVTKATYPQAVEVPATRKD